MKSYYSCVTKNFSTSLLSVLKQTPTVLKFHSLGGFHDKRMHSNYTECIDCLTSAPNGITYSWKKVGFRLLSLREVLKWHKPAIANEISKIQLFQQAYLILSSKFKVVAFLNLLQNIWEKNPFFS